MEEIFKSIQENERNRISNIVNSFSDSIEKAVIRQEGDIHPNGKWVWKKTPSGYDWRNLNVDKHQSKEQDVLRRAKNIGRTAEKYGSDIYSEIKEFTKENPELHRKIEEAAYEGAREYGEEQIKSLKFDESKFSDIIENIRLSEYNHHYKTKTLQVLSKKLKLEKYEKKFKALDALLDAETSDRSDEYNIPMYLSRYFNDLKESFLYEIKRKYCSSVERYVTRNYIK